MKTCHVINNTQLTTKTYLLEITKNIEFIAGQFVAISLANSEEKRLYSIASGEQDNTLKILYEVVPDGLLTNQLCQLKVGDRVAVSEPMGRFLPTHGKALWIATGTGIAPFISMLHSGYSNDKTLLHGSRTVEGFFFQDQFASLLGDGYLRFCTTETAPGIISGRLTHHLKQMDGLDPDILYYLCGSNQMVVDVREILINKGIPYENIKAEIYF